MKAYCPTGLFVAHLSRIGFPCSPVARVVHVFIGDGSVMRFCCDNVAEENTFGAVWSHGLNLVRRRERLKVKFLFLGDRRDHGAENAES